MLSATDSNWRFLKDPLLVLILLSALIEWGILFFRIRVFYILPHWWWKFHITDSLNDWLFIPLLILCCLGVLFILRSKSTAIVKLIMLVAMGICIQFSFGLIDGRGLEALRVKYINSGNVSYALHAADRPEVIDVLRQFEERYSEDIFLRTKPPGLLAIYVVLQKVAMVILPAHNYAGRVLSLTTLLIYVFGLLTFLTLIPLYGLGKSLLGKEQAIYPCLVYIFFPNLILIPLQLDLALYPLIFVSILWLTHQAVQRGSFFLGVVVGICLCLAIFISFSLLALIFMVAAWIGFEFLRSPGREKFKQLLLPALGIITGFACLQTLLWVALDYDIFLRYTKSMIKHREHKLYEEGVLQVLLAFLLNNAELVVWFSFPMALTFLSGFTKTLRNYFSPARASIDSLAMAALATWVFLNIFGQTRGETARLWGFMLPVVALISAPQIEALFQKKRTFGWLLMIGIQMITIFLIFKFQDYRF